MSNEHKCMASQDGICRNVYGFGIKCNGYSEQCRLRPVHNTLENIINNATKSMRGAHGIVGDQEE